MKWANSKAALVGAVLLIVVSVGWIVFNGSRPSQTVNDYSKVPPKGAGLKERG